MKTFPKFLVKPNCLGEEYVSFEMYVLSQIFDKLPQTVHGNTKGGTIHHRWLKPRGQCFQSVSLIQQVVLTCNQLGDEVADTES